MFDEQTGEEFDKPDDVKTLNLGAKKVIIKQYLSTVPLCTECSRGRKNGKNC
jgi:hypothetical protein